jgi:hypothetical protein
MLQAEEKGLCIAQLLSALLHIRAQFLLSGITAASYYIELKRKNQIIELARQVQR